MFTRLPDLAAWKKLSVACLLHSMFDFANTIWLIDSLLLCLPISLSHCLHACLPVCLLVCLPACLLLCLLVCLLVCLSVCPACTHLCRHNLPSQNLPCPHLGQHTKCHERKRMQKLLSKACSKDLWHHVPKWSEQKPAKFNLIFNNLPKAFAIVDSKLT